jgi:hypothetical protein
MLRLMKQRRAAFESGSPDVDVEMDADTGAYKPSSKSLDQTNHD